MIDPTPSYRCKVSEGNSLGSLRIGRRRFKVEVTEMSRDSFCVRVPSVIARKVAVGSNYRLFYQEMLWSVLCTQKWIGESNRVDLELKQLEELTPPRIRTTPLGGNARAVAAIGQTDSTLPVALLGAFIIVVLILPAWGGQWGTSQPMCNAVTSTWNALNELVTGNR